ncbi:hypothetical protein B7463_g10615, partial [Scytalidium lignicola]
MPVTRTPILFLLQFFSKRPKNIVKISYIFDIFAVYEPRTYNGIGKNSLTYFVKASSGSKPRVYFVGRSQERGDQIKSELSAINPDGYYEFISADVSVMASVDEVCREIIKKETYLNLLFMSQGTANHAAETSEKLPLLNATIYYSKIRFAVNLIPLLQNAPSLRRVVAVFAAGLEGQVAVDDMDGREISVTRNRDYIASMTTLALDKLSQESPDISWIHDWPGFVKSGLWHSMPGILGVVVRIIMPILGFFSYMKPEECGQHQVFMATSARFPPASSEGSSHGLANGVGLVDDLSPAESINGKLGGGMYSVNEHGDAIVEKILNLLVNYKKDGTQDKVWQYTMETFRRVTGKERLGKNL